uniref:Odorant-binding protein 18 n=1 Tax=Delia platura TaxID=81723 RepID=A0A0P0UVY8_9MUSC|nr:odorant-binding protein 18 [Delia platura]
MVNELRIIKILTIIMQIYVVAGIDCKTPVKVDPFSCCPVQEMISKEIVDKCTGNSKKNSTMATSVDSKASTTSTPTDPKPNGALMHSCINTCVLNETGVTTGMDFKLNETRLTEYLKLALNGSTDLIPVVENSFKTCSSELQKKMQDKMKNSPSTNMSQDGMMHNTNCSPFASHLLECVFLKSLKNCPKSVQTNTNICNEKIDYMKECIPDTFDNKENSS